MVNHYALLYSDEIKLTDIELRSRDYLIIPQTIIHSLQFNKLVVEIIPSYVNIIRGGYIFILTVIVLLFSIAAYFSALGKINWYLMPEQYISPQSYNAFTRLDALFYSEDHYISTYYIPIDAFSKHCSGNTVTRILA